MLFTAMLLTMYDVSYRGLASILMMTLLTELGFTATNVAGAASFSLMLSAIVTPAGPLFVEKIGIARLMFIQTTVVGSVCFLTSKVMETFHLYVLWGIAGVASGLSSAAIRKPIANAFEKSLGLAMGLIGGADAAGQLVFIPGLVWLVQTFGWRTAAQIQGVVGILLSVISFLTLFAHPMEIGIHAYGAEVGKNVEEDVRMAEKDTKAKKEEEDYLTRTLWKPAQHPAYWCLLITFGLCGWTSYGLVGVAFIPTIEESGMDKLTASFLLALIGVFDFIGTTISGVVCDMVEQPKYLLATYYIFRGLSTAAAPLILGARLTPTIFIFIAGIGLDYIATFPATLAVTYQVFGRANGPAITAWFALAHQVGSSIGGTGAGIFKDTFGSFLPWWILSGLSALVAGIISCAIPTEQVHLNMPPTGGQLM